MLTALLFIIKAAVTTSQPPLGYIKQVHLSRLGSQTYFERKCKCGKMVVEISLSTLYFIFSQLFKIFVYKKDKEYIHQNVNSSYIWVGEL
jgi:hypothetical protein